MVENSSEIAGLFKDSEFDKAVSETCFDVGERIVIAGHNIDFNPLDEEQGVFFCGWQGQIRCTYDISEGFATGFISIDIPEYLESGEYVVEIRRRFGYGEPLKIVRYPYRITIRGYFECHRKTLEDAGYEKGFRDGKIAGREEALKERNANDKKLFPQNNGKVTKKIVVKKRSA